MTVLKSEFLHKVSKSSDSQGMGVKMFALLFLMVDNVFEKVLTSTFSRVDIYVINIPRREFHTSFYFCFNSCFFDLRILFWLLLLLIIEKLLEFNIGSTWTVFFVENTPQVNFVFEFNVSWIHKPITTKNAGTFSTAFNSFIVHDSLKTQELYSNRYRITILLFNIPRKYEETGIRSEI